MSDPFIVGKQHGDTFLVAGRVHQQSKRSFTWRAFSKPIKLPMPVQGWKLDRQSSVKATGSTTTFAAAKAAILKVCPVANYERPYTSRGMVARNIGSGGAGWGSDSVFDPLGPDSLFGALAMASIAGRITRKR